MKRLLIKNKIMQTLKVVGERNSEAMNQVHEQLDPVRRLLKDINQTDISEMIFAQKLLERAQNDVYVKLSSGEIVQFNLMESKRLVEMGNIEGIYLDDPSSVAGVIGETRSDIRSAA